MKRPENLLIVADSEHDANMLYAVGTFVPDPFIYLRLRGRNYVVLSDLEIDRVRKQAPHCRALSFSQYQQQLRRSGARSPGLRSSNSSDFARKADSPDSRARQFSTRPCGRIAKTGSSHSAQSRELFSRTRTKVARGSPENQRRAGHGGNRHGRRDARFTRLKNRRKTAVALSQRAVDFGKTALGN